MVQADTELDIRCFYCGHTCEESSSIGEKTFRCYGCKTVYENLTMPLRSVAISGKLKPRWLPPFKCRSTV